MCDTGRSRSRHFTLICGVLLLATSLNVAGGLAITGVTLTEDGDNDGFADTRETVSVQLTVKNTSGQALSGVAANFANPVPTGCASTPQIAIGSLAVDEVKSVGPLVFVTELDRATLGLGPFDELAATFQISADSDQGEIPVFPPELTFDLDLEVSSGSGPTTFFESFEGSLGQFEIDNMDQGLTTLAAADGWHCQTSDPDWVNSNISGAPETQATCYPGITTAHADAVFWGLSGPGISHFNGRAFTGFHSLFFGIDLGEPTPGNFTTPLSILEAARTSSPIALGWSGVTPTLTFKHQISFVDELVQYDGGFDRGVVMLQFADDLGNPVGNWIKIYAHQNPYVHISPKNSANCFFDPIDDGNTEDDFFDPTDPARRLGPSSTCDPGTSFMEMGETSTFFDAANIGGADGPGLAGVWGIGTWIESEFDLSRFRGRQVRLRFLVSASRIGELETWEEYPQISNPEPDDDGWWIDDVTIQNALTTPATVWEDTKDNSALPGLLGPNTDGDGFHDICDNCPELASPNGRDGDGDGVGDVCDSCPFDPESSDGTDHDDDRLCVDNCPFLFNPQQVDSDGDGSGEGCDCAPGDPTTYPGAPEVNDGLDNQCDGDLGSGLIDEISGNSGFHQADDKSDYSWTPQQGATLYQVGRATKPDFKTGCSIVTTSDTSFADLDPVPPDSIRFYLVRATAPNIGSWGRKSAGGLRILGFGCSGP